MNINVNLEKIGIEYAEYCYSTFCEWSADRMPRKDSTELSCYVNDWSLQFLENYHPEIATRENADIIYNIAYEELNEYYLSEN